MTLWKVKPDEERDHWSYTPFTHVGPLRFGMSHDEVVTALGAAGEWASESEQNALADFGELGVSTYYSLPDGFLCGVAVDALAGPQVSYAGVDLVGRKPSEIDDWLIGHVLERGFELRYTDEGIPGSSDVGFATRVQRAGDYVLTRPVFMTRDWYDVPWDRVPSAEWRVH